MPWNWFILNYKNKRHHHFYFYRLFCHMEVVWRSSSVTALPTCFSCTTTQQALILTSLKVEASLNLNLGLNYQNKASNWSKYGILPQGHRNRSGLGQTNFSPDPNKVNSSWLPSPHFHPTARWAGPMLNCFRCLCAQSRAVIWLLLGLFPPLVFSSATNISLPPT